MEGKKISFGFMKTKKVEKPVIEEKKDYIECLEEKSIKVVGGEEAKEEKPLVIPLKPNTLITAERLKQIAEKVEGGLEEPVQVKEETVEIKTEPTENLTLDELAVRELLQDAKKEIKVEKQELTVPVPAKPVLEGQKESTLEDYESVPVQDFGMAMLRGMGWTPNKELLAKHKQPELRPKGLGLGADKVISEKQKKKGGNKNKHGKDEELAIVKNSYVKIIAGKYSGYYGKVVSLDEDNGRVMVDLAVRKETVSLSEFMMQAVTKAEFDKESKVINTDAYQEYKKKEKSQEEYSSRNEQPKVSERQRRESPKVSERETSNNRSTELKEESRRKDDKYNGISGRKQERSRRDNTDNDVSRKKKEYKRDSSSSEEKNDRRERSRRNSSSSEDRSDRKRKEKTKRDSSGSEDRSSSRQKERSRRYSPGSKDRNIRKTERSKRDSSSEDRSSRRRIEKSKRDLSVERSRKRSKNKKKYDSDESLDSISDSEKKSKSKHNRKTKDSSDSESDPRSHKKDKRDIDKKRKGKKKKRDRDRSPNYKKHRK